jgi:hypothetical protein
VQLLLALGVAVPAAGVAAQFPLRLTVDRDLSMPAGVTSMLTVESLLWRAQDLLLPSRLVSEHGLGGKSVGVGYRLARLVLLDDALATFSMVATHELFGHGARAREFGWSTSYQFSAPPPSGSGSGLTSSNIPGGRIPVVEDLLFSAGGMESSNLGGRVLVHAWVSRGRAGYHEQLRYLWTQLDPLGYIHGASAGEGDDVDAYLAALNTVRTGQGKGRYTRATLQGQSVVLLANPFFWESLAGVLGTHLVGGGDSASVPMIHIGDARYLPYLRYALTPFGPEVHLEQLLVRGARSYALDLSGNVDGPASSWSALAEVTSVWQRKAWSVDARAASWHQPRYTLRLDEAQPPSSRFGGMVSLTVNWRPPALGARAIPGAFAELGYKSDGFVEGERLGHGGILRVGILVR